MVTIRSAYSVRRVLDPYEWGPSLTKQSMKAETDINNILARYAKSGLLTHLAGGTPQWLDVSEVSDYREAIERVRAADTWFSGLPAKMRETFHNDPAAFLDFASDPSNDKMMAELGLEGRVKPAVNPNIDRKDPPEQP